MGLELGVCGLHMRESIQQTSCGMHYMSRSNLEECL